MGEWKGTPDGGDLGNWEKKEGLSGEREVFITQLEFKAGFLSQ